MSEGQQGAAPADAALLGRAASGDRLALGELLRRHAGAAYAAILSRAGSRRDVEDLVQETLRRAVAGIGGLRDPGRLGAWVYGIAIRVHAEAGRRRRTPAASLEALPFEPAAPEAGDPDLEERLERLRKGLAGLEEPDREALTLHYLEGLDYEAMAGLLSLTRAGVSQRLSRARTRLRERMREEAP